MLHLFHQCKNKTQRCKHYCEDYSTTSTSTFSTQQAGIPPTSTISSQSMGLLKNENWWLSPWHINLLAHEAHHKITVGTMGKVQVQLYTETGSLSLCTFTAILIRKSSKYTQTVLFLDTDPAWLKHVGIKQGCHLHLFICTKMASIL